MTAVVVRTGGGRLAGEAGPAPGSAVFRGVPYARPPVGPLRWRAAEPLPPWEGVRDATAFGPASLQPAQRPGSLIREANYADARPPRFDEDCLYLNVWTPDAAPGARLPVLVWLHGGGNRVGWGSQDLYDGSRLAARGIVVVTLNFRLGAAGFLAHPALAADDKDGASGHYALTDMLAALRWVRAGIGAFGGDPDAVTLAGSSTGAGAVCHLMASPLARGLFHRAVGQSLSGFATPHRPVPGAARAERTGREWTDGLGLGGAVDAAALRALPATALAHRFLPAFVIDGTVLTEDTGAVFEAGRQARIPLLAGSNADEGATYTKPRTPAEIRASLADLGPGRALAGACYPAGTDAQARRAYRDETGDRRMRWRLWKWATVHARTSAAPVWLYHLTQAPPVPLGALGVPGPGDGLADYGAYHTAELPYMWDNLDALAWPWRAADRELARTMADGWARFVSAGDPRGAGLADWAPLEDGLAGPARVLGPGGRAGPVPRGDAMRFQDLAARPG